MSYKIDKDVSLPSRANYGRWTEVMKKMKPGDSFFVPEADFAPSAKQGVRSSVSSCAKNFGFKVASRTVEGGLRFWRLS